MEQHETHQQALIEAFAEVLRGEERSRIAKTELQQVSTRLESEINAGENDARGGWDKIQALLAETGEVEVILPGAVTDYKLGWDTPRERVKVEPDAVPEEFSKVERKPKLKEIGEFLKGLRKGGLAFPNWARFETSDAKLVWKSVKKSTKE